MIRFIYTLMSYCMIYLIVIHAHSCYFCFQTVIPITIVYLEDGLNRMLDSPAVVGGDTPISILPDSRLSEL